MRQNIDAMRFPGLDGERTHLFNPLTVLMPAYPYSVSVLRTRNECWGQELPQDAGLSGGLILEEDLSIFWQVGNQQGGIAIFVFVFMWKPCGAPLALDQ